MSTTLTMARWVHDLNYDALPPRVLTKTKELLLDSLACGLGGSRTPIGRIARELAAQFGGQKQATILGSGDRGPCNLAAYANASATNTLDYDDTGKGGHPGSTIIPATLALGQKLGANGKSILTACVAGYEIGTRVALAIEPGWERYLQIHGIGTAQTFGAMAACTKLLNLDLDQTLNAFGIAGATAPVAHAGKFGWTDKSIAFVKDNVAWPSEAGLRAALLAQSGFEGSESIMDGDQGYWVMAGSDKCDFNRLTDFSGFEITKVSLKPYPCCRWIHTTLDALVELIQEHRFGPDEVERIEVFSNQALGELFGRTTPRTFVDVEFSVPCTVALKLHAIPHSAWYRKENWNNPDILALAAKVGVHLEADYQALFMELGRGSSRIPARIDISLTNGRQLSNYCDLASGSPLKPMTEEAKLAKVKDLTAELLSGQAQDRLIGQLGGLEEIADIGQVLNEL